ncbi:MAG: RluA family pseudouridine synthase [Alphaproteobacteria bacterium]|nr:RluA family pseudouridine synthase [Alphaproteobacteria bacterium]
MTGVQMEEVAVHEAGQRLDRWVARRLPGLPQGRLQKLLRTGQVRVDGRRARAGDRLEAGAMVRLPPSGPAPETRPAPLPDRLVEEVRGWVLHLDEAVIALDKPAGLAVQGGKGTPHHLDGMLEALRFDAPERPRLVHRLDKDTSGVLLLARSAADAARLTAAFRAREAEKLYWAVTAGAPEPPAGRIALALAKRGRPGGERVAADAGGKKAVTDYETLARAGKRAARLALRPLTGRTHQLRAHLAAIGCPILGDGKYGGRTAFLEGIGLEPRLHLHARAIALEHPRGRGWLEVEAPAPPLLETAFRQLGLEVQGDASFFR